MLHSITTNFVFYIAQEPNLICEGLNLNFSKCIVPFTLSKIELLYAISEPLFSKMAADLKKYGLYNMLHVPTQTLETKKNYVFLFFFSKI